MMTDKQVIELEAEGPTDAGWSRLINELVHTRDVVNRLKEEARYNHDHNNKAYAHMLTLELELMEMKR